MNPHRIAIRISGTKPAESALAHRRVARAQPPLEEQRPADDHRDRQEGQQRQQRRDRHEDRADRHDVDGRQDDLLRADVQEPL
jgi:hypothetical protein